MPSESKSNALNRVLRQIIRRGTQHRLPNFFVGVFASILAIAVVASASVGQELLLTEFLAIEPVAEARLDQPITASWDGVALGEVARRLTETTGIAIWIDRRVDHTRPVQFTAKAMPLVELVESIAALHKLQSQRIGPVIYIATAKRVARLRIAIAQNRQLAKTSRRELTDQHAWEWEKLTTPAALIERIGNQDELTVYGIELVPHDLLAARSISRISSTDLLTLLLFGFDLTFHSGDTASLVIEKLPNASTIDRRYTLVDRHREKMLAAAKPLSENAQRRGNDLWIRGNMADHESFARAAGLLATATAKPRPQPVADLSDRRFTLRVRDQRADFVIEQLATQLGATVDKSKLRSDDFGSRISFDVKTVTIDELLSEIADQAGVAIRRQGQAWTITPR